MTLLDRLLDRRDPVEHRAITSAGFWKRWAAGDEGPPGVDPVSGVHVDRSSALGLGAVWACVSLIGDSIATLPANIVEPRPGGGWRTIDAPKPAWLDVPNTEQTKVDFAFNQVASLLLDGTAIVYKVLDGRGNILEAWALDPSMVTILREPDQNGTLRLVYYVTANKGMQSPVGPFRIPEGPEIFHINAFQSASNWPRGLPPLEIARRMFGGSIAGQEMAASFFTRGMNAPGFIETPEGLTPDQARELKSDLQKGNAGSPRNMQFPPVLTGGAHFVPSLITPEQSQFIEQRRFSVEEVARFFRVPPFMVGELSKTTTWGTGVEQQGIGFVKYTLRPWIERLEEAWTRHMLFLTPGYRIRFDVDELLRGDSAARSEYYSKMFQVAAVSPAAIALAENLPELGPEGDRHYYPVNMAVVEGDQLEPPPKPAPAPAPAPATTVVSGGSQNGTPQP
jgi:HK97 family phage portal protein